MKIVLLQDMPNLGKKGDTKDVKNGYGRNFLLRNKLANILTPSLEKVLKLEHEKQEKSTLALKENMELLQKKIQNINLVFEMKVGESGRVYGSITPLKILSELKKQGINLEKEQIIVKPIKTLGNSKIKIKLHPDVEVFFNILVKPINNKNDIKKH